MTGIRKTAVFWDADFEMLPTFRANVTEEPNNMHIIKT